MQVGFEKMTHNFWSVSKDKMVKYWDGDKVSSLQLPLLRASTGLKCLGDSLNAFKSLMAITERFGLLQSATEETLSSLVLTTSQFDFGKRRTNL